MQLVAVLGIVAFMLAGVVVGARILLLARRTRQLPELYLGAGLFLYAALGQPAIAASRPIAEAFGHEARLVAVGLGLLGNVVAMVGIYLFTWTVYRRHSKWALGVAGLAGVAAVVSSIAVFRSIPETIGALTPATRLGIAALAMNFGIGMSWTAWESLRYYGMLRRRLALGLAEPVVADRFRLWGIGCSAAGLVCFAIIACVAAGLNIAVHPLPLMLTSLAGSTTACCWYLAFLPPAGYLRWIGVRASA